MAGGFCAACGSPSVADAVACSKCGSALVGAATGLGEPRGLSIKIKTGTFAKQTGYVAEVDGSTMRVLVPKGPARTVPIAAATDLLLTSDAASVRVAQAVCSEPDAVLRRYLEALLDEELLPDLAQSRALALHGLVTADSALIERARLSDLEHRWLLGNLAWRTGRRTEAAALLCGLPPGAYPDVEPILACLWRELKADPGLRNQAIERNKCAPSTAWTRALTAILNTDGEPDLASLSSIAEFLSLPSSPPGVEVLSAWRDWMRSVADAIAPVALSTNTGIGGVFGLRIRWLEKQTSSLTVDASVVPRLPLALIDDLIDQGVPVDADSLGEQRLDDYWYVMARTSPAAIPDEQLSPLGFERERLRRAILDGDFEALRSLRSSDAELVALSSLARADTAAVADVARFFHERGDEQRRRRALSLGRSMSTGVIESEIVLDRSCWPVLERLLPDPASWSTLATAMQGLAAWSVLRAAIQALWDGRWEDAEASARDALRVGGLERTRDEALNILAYANWMLDKDEAARGALSEAVEDERSANLQVNYSIVVGSSVDLDDKYLASIQLAELAEEASNLEQGVHAVQRALALWNEIPYGSDIGDNPPDELIAAARRLAVEPTDEDQHDLIMSFLAWADSDWLEHELNTTGSRWANTIRHRYRVVRASGGRDSVAVLKDAVTPGASAADGEWARREAASVAEMLTRAILADLDDPPLGAAIWGLELSDTSAIEDDALAVRLEILCATAAAQVVASSDDGYPASLLWDHVENAIVRNETADAGVDESFIAANVHHYAYVCFPAWARRHDLFVDPLNSIMAQLVGLDRYRANRAAVRSATDPLLSAISELDHDIHAVRIRVEIDDVAENLDDLCSSLAEMRSKILRLPR